MGKITSTKYFIILIYADSSLSDLTNITQANYEYIRPTSQTPDGTFCCKNTQYTACTVSKLYDYK